MRRLPGIGASALFAALTSCVLLLPAGLAAEEEQALYTWIDDEGTVHYSDTPDDPRARKLPLGTRRTDLSRVQSELQGRESDARERAEAQLAAAEEEEQAALEAAERRRRCERAQARLRTLSVARRPFRVDEQGQQLFLTDGQIAEERSAAEQSVNENCN